MAVMVQLHTPADLTLWKAVHGACPVGLDVLIEEQKPDLPLVQGFRQ
jgi:hypothetical protein